MLGVVLYLLLLMVLLLMLLMVPKNEGHDEWLSR